MKTEHVIGLLIAGLGAMWVLNEISKDPRTSPFWRFVAQSAEGDIYQHVVSKELITLLA